MVMGADGFERIRQTLAIIAIQTNCLARIAQLTFRYNPLELLPAHATLASTDLLVYTCLASNIEHTSQKLPKTHKTENPNSVYLTNAWCKPLNHLTSFILS